MISEYLGIDSDYIVIGLAALVLILIIVMIVNAAKMHSLKKAYNNFMTGKDAKNLEDTILKRLDQVEQLMDSNEKNINRIFSNMKYTFQKVGLVKYDAFNEMGGKLSFSLALLSQTNDGFIINAMHSREGCYTYIKEIIDGNSVITLSEEEQEALDMALNSNKK